MARLFANAGFSAPVTEPNDRTKAAEQHRGRCEVEELLVSYCRPRRILGDCSCGRIKSSSEGGRTNRSKARKRVLE